MASNSGRVRIVGGQWRSRIISFPFHADLRPTPDRVRETLFNWLGQDLTGLKCLDLFAGSGALGFEAASRGAEQVVMVESNSSVFKGLSDNKSKLKAEQVELIKMDAGVFLTVDTREFDVVFLDPPYRLDILPKIVPLLPSHLSKDGQVYLEAERFNDIDQLLLHWQIRRKTKAGKVNSYLIELEQEFNNCG